MREWKREVRGAVVFGASCLAGGALFLWSRGLHGSVLATKLAWVIVEVVFVAAAYFVTGLIFQKYLRPKDTTGRSCRK